MFTTIFSHDSFLVDPIVMVQRNVSQETNGQSSISNTSLGTTTNELMIKQQVANTLGHIRSQQEQHL